MMRAILLLVSLAISFSLSAQKKLEFRTRYYSKDNKLLETSEGAYYYSYDTVGKAYGETSYYMSNNQVKMQAGPGGADKPRNETWYYENGTKKLKGTTLGRKPVGRLSMWYSNGQSLAELEFDTTVQIGSVRDYKIIHYWDSLGVQLVTDGNGFGHLQFFAFAEGGKGAIVDGKKDGVWTGKDKAGSYAEQYDKGKLLGGTTNINGRRYKYTVLSEPPKLVDGIDAFYKKLANTLTYPKSARRDGKEGTVFIAFYVLENGTMAGFDLMKGFDPECDAEAFYTLKKLSPKWTPEINRGVPTRAEVVLPIKFKLS